MILFQKEFIPKILSGEKYKTYRFWLNCRAKVGSIHWAQTNLKPESRFARILIEDVKLWDRKTMTLEDAKADGFDSVEAFWEKFNELNTERWDDRNRKGYIVTFRVLKDGKVPLIGSPKVEGE